MHFNEDEGNRSGRAHRILVAEDEVMTRTIIAGIVGKDGFEVVTASNGREAWEMLTGENPPSVAIVDWMMPEMTGIEICRKLREMAGTPYIYVILLTSRSAKEDIVAGLDAGADDFVSKPANPNELRSRLAVGIRTINYERMIEQRNRELAIFREAFNSCVQEMWISDTNRRILHANPSAAEKYGYPMSDLIGKDVLSLLETPDGFAEQGGSPAERARLLEEATRAINDPRTGVWKGPVFTRTRDGRTIWADMKVSAIRYQNAEPMAFVAVPVDITERVHQELNIRLECYNALSALAEARDNETGMHLKRLSNYAKCLAQMLGMSRRYVEDIASFAPLHDIGKVGIPDSILLAPRKLTPEEFEIMKKHSVIGYDILKNRPTLEMAAEIAYTHHEKFNGKGYPRGLKGEEIPLSGRIVAVLDVYDALRSERPYKAPWPHEKAVEVILQEAGEHFDPAVVDAFDKIQEKLAAIYEQDNEGASAPPEGM